MGEVSLDPASMLEEATKLTGLSDFCDEPFREPFERLCAALDWEARLNAEGRAAQRQRVLDILVTRARSEVYFQRHLSRSNTRNFPPLFTFSDRRSRWGYAVRSRQSSHTGASMGALQLVTALQ